MKVNQAIDQFLQYIASVRRLSANTLKVYGDCLACFQTYLKEQQHIDDLQDVGSNMVREWQVSLMERELRPATVKKNLAALRAWFKYLRREEIVHEDIMCKIVSPKLPKHLPIFFRESETDHLYERANFPDGFEGDRDQLLLRLLYETGMRRSELAALTEGSVDLSALTLKVIGKRDKERFIPIENDLAQNIKRYLTLKKEREGTKVKYGRKQETTIVHSDNLLVRNNGKAITSADIYTIVRRYMDVFSNAERRSPHIFRHSFATQMLNEGADIDAIKELLGHTDLAATEIYTHVTREHLKETYNHAHPRAKKRR
jgi:integrase/recombinase XerC